MKKMIGKLLYQIGMLHLTTRKYAVALDWLYMAKRRIPEDFWTNYYIATALMLMEKRIDALERAHELRAAFPENENAGFLLSFLLSANFDYEASLAEIDRALILRPGWKKAVNQKARLLFILGRDEATTYVEDNQLDLKDFEKYKAGSSERRYLEASRLFFEGQTGQAARELEALLNDDPNHEGALALLGAYYTDKKKYDLAVSCLLRCLRLNRKNTLARSNLALCYFKLGEISLARKHANKAVRRNPDIGLPYLVLAEVYERSNRLGKKSLVNDLRRKAKMRGYSEKLTE